MKNNRLIVALDCKNTDEARQIVGILKESVGFYKIGLELAYGGGFDLIPWLKDQGKDVFLDLKLHDIPNTVHQATKQIARQGAKFLTIHAYPQTMKAAREAVEGTDLELLAVTVMTSMQDEDVKEAGFMLSARELVLKRAQQAKIQKIHGLILSPQELQEVRVAVGSDMKLVTPGIRPQGADLQDQKRVMTPAEAIRAGADYLVIGRPIVKAEDPYKAACEIAGEIG